ncbi:MAG: hypothetical protein NTW11_01500 [Candidatus Staskawiczbacteria bacterium]|nr:hypothetical protein [Candidatus Staskawiczbacteria bacterium]
MENPDFVTHVYNFIARKAKSFDWKGTFPKTIEEIINTKEYSFLHVGITKDDLPGELKFSELPKILTELDKAGFIKFDNKMELKYDNNHPRGEQAYFVWLLRLVDIGEFLKNNSTSINGTMPSEQTLAQAGTAILSVSNGKSYTLVKNGMGYFKFYKEGKDIKIGKGNTRQFRLLQCLTEPSFGIQKTIEAVFEGIKLPKDDKDTRLSGLSSPQRKTRMLEIIEFTKKELQKIKDLQGKINYCMDDKKQNMWLN